MSRLKPKLSDSLIRLLKNWIAQGLLYTDKTEFYFRLFVTTLLYILTFTLGYLAFGNDLIHNNSILLTLLILSHSLSWLASGSLPMFLIDQHIVNVRENEVEIKFSYIDRLEKKVKNLSYIDSCLLYGSMCRGEVHSRSDIDIRYVPAPSFLSTFQTCIFALKERIYCLFFFIPLGGGQVFNSIENLGNKMSSVESPVVIKNTSNSISRYYAKSLSIKDCKKINGFRDNV